MAESSNVELPAASSSTIAEAGSRHAQMLTVAEAETMLMEPTRIRRSPITGELAIWIPDYHDYGDGTYFTLSELRTILAIMERVKVR